MLWTDGILLKLLNLKIQGKMFNWIKNFLDGRKIKVKVGNMISEEHETENGTPQGSSLSLILFLIMINDFPKLSTYTTQSLFADDSAVWRSGTN